MQSRFEEAFWPGLSISSNLGAQSYRNSKRIFDIEESNRIIDNNSYYDNLNTTKNEIQTNIQNKNNLNLFFSPSNSQSLSNQESVGNHYKSAKQQDSDTKMKTAIPNRLEDQKLESK